jgi:leucyl-tRNA---protein transferase
MQHVVPAPTYSHFPNLPPPVRVRLVTLPEHPCPYLPTRQAISRAFIASTIEPDAYHQFMNAGFRRSGRLVYQPVCVGCRECQSIRLLVDDFKPGKSHRRAVRRNGDVEVTTHRPVASHEKYEIYRRYCLEWHDANHEPTWEGFVEFLYDTPVNTVEFEYRDGTGRLLAVGICDVCSESLSSVYFYFDPDASTRGLGTFGVLREIEFAKQAGIPLYYLGYWVRGCATMHYKVSFRPSELLGMDGQWRPVARVETESDQVGP